MAIPSDAAHSPVAHRDRPRITGFVDEERHRTFHCPHGHEIPLFRLHDILVFGFVECAHRIPALEVQRGFVLCEAALFVELLPPRVSENGKRVRRWWVAEITRRDRQYIREAELDLGDVLEYLGAHYSPQVGVPHVPPPDQRNRPRYDSPRRRR